MRALHITPLGIRDAGREFPRWPPRTVGVLLGVTLGRGWRDEEECDFRALAMLTCRQVATSHGGPVRVHQFRKKPRASPR